jgi:hypothetical protein
VAVQTWDRRVRDALGALGLRAAWRRFLESRYRRREAAKVRAGEARRGFGIWGDDFGFQDILGCARFLTGLVPGSSSRRR